MTVFPVRYKIYDSTGLSLLYTFTLVQKDDLPEDSLDYSEIQGLRGIGSIIIPGSISAFNITLEFYIQGQDYTSLMAAVDLYLATVAQQTKYILSVDRTPSTTVQYHIMRLTSPKLESDDFRTGFMKVTQEFRVNCW